MNKNIKNLLFGLGTIAAGYIVYEIYKKQKLESETIIPDTNVYKPKTVSKEYLDRRREIIKKAHEKKSVKPSKSKPTKETKPVAVETDKNKDMDTSVNSEKKHENIESTSVNKALDSQSKGDS